VGKIVSILGSDAELIAQYKINRDKNLVGVLYKRYSHLVMGLCMKYLKDEEEAEDAVIDIFKKLFDDLLKHKVEYFKSWLYTYSKNHCLMLIRSRNSKKLHSDAYAENIKALMENSEDAHHKAKLKEQEYLALERALSQLPEEQKTCVTLFYLKDKSYQEIATETGYNLNQVKSFIQNGKRNLKLKLEKENGE
jgi:RNA polymerase sigma-70 factor (ECF subfamily)